ncbi:MAG: hypothetical protein A4E47_01621 [Methanosaeta sp. PtaU1.Bin028]|nr:MAG: hypothetical protein A4E47_01621 [Methanosaeta sp. PtaU1.Bin028]
MVRLQLGDNIVVDTDQAVQHWGERGLDGEAVTGLCDRQDLYRSKKGRYYVIHTSQYQGVEEMSSREAALWLLKNCHDLPEDLAHHEEAVIE